MLTENAKLPKLFLHYFDIHFVADKGSIAASRGFYDEMRLATRLAVASADRVFIPASSYFESEQCRSIVNELDILLQTGLIVLVGGSVNLDGFIAEKLDTDFYRNESYQHDTYSALRSLASTIPYSRRNRSSTRDVADYWTKQVESDGLQRLIREATSNAEPEIERRLEQVPLLLGNSAFIPEHVFEILGLPNDHFSIQSRIRSVINYSYFDSFVRDLDAGMVADLNYLGSTYALPSVGSNLSYRTMIHWALKYDMMEKVKSCDPIALIKLGDAPAWQAALKLATKYVGERRKGPEHFVSELVQLEAVKHSPMHADHHVVNSGELIEWSSRVSLAEVQPNRSVLCIVASPSEFSSVREYLELQFGAGIIKYLDDDKSHAAVEHHDAKSGTTWRVAQLSFQAETEAALGVQRLHASCEPIPNVVMMVGMCMGMPKKKLSPGTVVVPNEVTALDHQKALASSAVYRPHGQRVDNPLYTMARVVASNPFPFIVIADKGLASSSVKIEDPNAAIVQYIESSLPDVVAFDMEGSGFYRAAAGTKCLWIKAVADSAEPQDATAVGRAAKHATQSSATTNAIIFAVAVVQAHFRA